MSFGLRAFKQIKEESKKQIPRVYVRNLIIGRDIASVLKLIKTSDAKIINSNEITINDLKNNLEFLANTIRTEEAAHFLIERFPKLNIRRNELVNKFYKDQGFKEFGGRSKSFSLLEGEEYFAGPSYLIDWENLITENLDQIETALKDNQEQKVIQKICKVTATDMVEPANFEVHFADETVFSCENIFWGRSTKELTKLLDKESDFPSEFIEACKKERSLSGVVVKYSCEGIPVTEEGTLFIPQSQTHEWGHFILESKANIELNQQELIVTAFINENEVNAEGVAKKIRLMQKTLERVFEDFAKTKYKESIICKENILVEYVEDEIFAFVKDAMNLKIIGQSYSLQNIDSNMKINYLARLLASI